MKKILLIILILVTIVFSKDMKDRFVTIKIYHRITGNIVEIIKPIKFINGVPYRNNITIDDRNPYGRLAIYVLTKDTDDKLVKSETFSYDLKDYGYIEEIRNDGMPSQ